MSKARNTLVNLIKGQIAKKNNLINHYEAKSNETYFIRDGVKYINSYEWQSYWIEVAAHIEEETEALYDLLKIVHKNKIGELSYPVAPTVKTKWKD